MSHVKIIKSNENYKIIEPLGSLSDSFGYMMVVDNKGRVLKFFRSGAVEEAVKYFDYISLSRIGKVKYWLDYKRSG